MATEAAESVPSPQLPPDFKLVKDEPLGKGNFGKVLLCEYQGTDEKIKQLCDAKGRIALKILNKPDMQEAKISEYLLQQVDTAPNLKRNFVLAMQLGGSASLIVSKPVLYDFENGVSADLQSFMKKINATAGISPLSSEIVDSFTSHTGLSVSQLIGSMRDSQESLHEAGILHLDSAMRNYLVNPPIFDSDGNAQFSVTIADYGVSEIIPEEGVIAMSEEKTRQLSARLLDGNGFASWEATVTSDIYALKVSAISLCGMALGAGNENAMVALKEITTMRDFMLARRDSKYNDDSLALNDYLDNVKALVDQCPDKSKQQEMQFFIESYREYLTTVPPTSSTKDEAHNADHELLMKANAKFMIKVFEAKLQATDLQNPIQMKELSVLARRLNTLETNDAFKKSEFYQKLTTHAVSSEQKINQSELLDRVTQIEEGIKKQLGPHKWTFITGEAMGKHPRALLAQTLKNEMDQLKQDVRDGKVTSLQSIDASVKGMHDRLSQTNEPTSQKISTKQVTSTMASFKQQPTVKTDEAEVPHPTMKH